MSDPITLLASIYSVYASIKDVIETVKVKQKEFLFIQQRCDALLDPLNTFQNHSAKLVGKEKALANIKNLLEGILAFVSQQRFQGNGIRNLLEKSYYLYEDAASLKDFSEKLSHVAQDLGVVLQLNTVMDLAEIKRERSDIFKDALQTIGKEQLLATQSSLNMDAIKGELDKAIKATTNLNAISAESASDSSTNTEADTTSASAKYKLVQLTPINFTRLEFNETKSPRLGQGSFGDVFACRYKNKDAALKRLPRTLSLVKDSTLLRSLKREALIMQYVDHPNVIGFLGASLEQNLILLELACGSLEDALYSPSTIHDRLQGTTLNPLIRTLEWRIDMVRDIGSALRYLHRNNIIHRDIKAANVLLVLDNNALVAKVCDFGLSQAVEFAVSTVGTRANQKAVGTTNYMPPELFSNSKPAYSWSTDMYSFGVLVAELFVEERPWQNIPVAALSHSLVNERQRPLVGQWNTRMSKLSEVSEIEKSLYSLVGDANSGCLAENPEIRSDANAFVELCTPVISDDIDVYSSLSTFLKQPKQQTATIAEFEESNLEVSERSTQLMSEINTWMHRNCPDISRARALGYSKNMMLKKITTMDRLKRVLDQSQNYSQCLQSELGFHPLDADDVCQSLNSSNQAATNTSSRPQGSEVLMDWLQKCPDISMSSRKSIVHQLVANNIVTSERLIRLVLTPEHDFSFLSVHPLDWFDISQVAAGKETSRLKAIVNTSNTLTEVCGDPKEILANWFNQYMPNTDNLLLNSYVSTLLELNITTISRLQMLLTTLESNLPPPVMETKKTLLEVIDPLDIDDLKAAFKLSSPPKSDRHGALAIGSWMCAMVPSVSRCEQYSKLIADAGVKTVTRLKRVIASNKMFLTSLGIDECDSVDLIEAVHKHMTGTVYDESKILEGSHVAEAETRIFDWIISFVPSVLENSALEYARRIVQQNVSTIDRLIAAKDNWLLETLGEDNKLDVEDIIQSAKELEMYVAKKAPTFVVRVGEKEGRISRVNKNALLCTIECFDGTRVSDVTIKDISKVVSPAVAMSSNRVELDNTSIRQAVKLWFENRAEAESKYGHISDWDTSKVTNMSYLFRDKELGNDDTLGKWDVNNVINMSCMFWCANNFNQPLASWDVSNVTTMSHMFYGASSFNQPLNSWNVSNVTDMSYMFAKASSFNQPLESWNVTNVTDTSNMFYGASSFNQPLASWDVSNVTDMSGMFCFANRFNKPLESWDVSNVTNMSSLFFAATSFNQPLDSWNVSNVTDMSSMFRGASSFNQQLDSWNVSNVTDMSSMFRGASSFNQTLASWDVSNVTDMSHMFNGALFNQPLDSWNVINVKNMRAMFACATSFNQSLESWDVSNVTDMSHMFSSIGGDFDKESKQCDCCNSWWARASRFNQSLASWNVGKVTNMSHMFRGASSFTYSLQSWNVSNVTDMSSMFNGASSFNQSLDSWNVSKVTNMSHMFNGASSFNQPLASWNVSNVTDMSHMFNGAVSFNQPLESWRVSNMTDLSHMFASASSFNQLLASWDVSNVNNMSNMFLRASSFNQPLASWDVSKVTNMSHMFSGATSFNQPLDSWNVSNVTDMSHMFSDDDPDKLYELLFASDYGTKFNQPLESWNVSNVTDMCFMFHGATSFNQPLNSWNVSNVTKMQDMFSGALLFNQPLASWNVSNVTSSCHMFYNAIAFNQPLDTWDVSNVKYMSNMFRGAVSFNQPLNSWNVSNVKYMNGILNGASSFRQPLDSWNVSKVTDLDDVIVGNLPYKKYVISDNDETVKQEDVVIEEVEINENAERPDTLEQTSRPRASRCIVS